MVSQFYKFHWFSGPALWLTMVTGFQALFNIWLQGFSSCVEMHIFLHIFPNVHICLHLHLICILPWQTKVCCAFPPNCPKCTCLYFKMCAVFCEHFVFRKVQILNMKQISPHKSWEVRKYYFKPNSTKPISILSHRSD